MNLLYGTLSHWNLKVIASMNNKNRCELKIKLYLIEYSKRMLIFQLFFSSLEEKRLNKSILFNLFIYLGSLR